MSGGTALTSRISATLRRAGLPVLRYSDRIGGRGRSGIRVGNYSSGTSVVSFFVYCDEESNNREFDTERELSDQARAVLTGAGFNVSHTPEHTTLTIQNGTHDAEDVRAVVEASGLDINQPGPTEWHVAVDGKRGAYSIRRTGSGDRMRYAVHSGTAVLAGKLWSMRDAIDVVEIAITKTKR